MITYAERVCFRPSHLDLLKRSELLVSRVAASWGNELRCHEIVRALHEVLGGGIQGLFVVDGKCGPIEHSWLRFADGSILDPYVPGRLPAVQIIDAIVGGAYRGGTERDDIRAVIVQQLVREMREEAA